jgi:hypothetical protein
LFCATPFNQIDLKIRGTADKTADLKDKESAENGPFETEEFIHLSPWALKTGCCEEEGSTILPSQ